MRLLIGALIVVLASLGTAALASQDGATVADTSTGTFPPYPDQPTNVQDIQVAVAQQVPGFGGLFVDPATPDRLKIWLTDADTQLEPARSALSKLVGNYPQFDVNKIDPLPGRYGFLELQDWHDSLFQQIALIPTVVSTDVQEGTNTIDIGVQDESTSEVVKKDAAVLGIPADALDVEITSPPQLSGQLNNWHRPVVGGLQIYDANTHFYGSLGVVARRGGHFGTPGVLTVSHLTSTYLGPDGNWLYQEDDSPINNVIGFEVVDPTPWPGVGGVCPAGIKCRFSDAAWFQSSTGAGTPTPAQGEIARPSPGSTNWDGSTTFSIEGAVGPYVGEALLKVGETTGRTGGLVIATNENESAPNLTGVWLLWQHEASYRCDHGDSGGPVFYNVNEPTVDLTGITWGIGHYPDGSENHNDCFFSDAQYVNFGQDLGANLYYAVP